MSELEMFQFLATLSAALFAGAAIYINVAEHPARMRLDTRSAAMQWAPSYKRATWMQAPLAIVSFLSGVGGWFLGGGLIWLVAALFIGAVVPIHRRRGADHFHRDHADKPAAVSCGA